MITLQIKCVLFEISAQLWTLDFLPCLISVFCLLSWRMCGCVCVPASCASPCVAGTRVCSRRFLRRNNSPLRFHLKPLHFTQVHLPVERALSWGWVINYRDSLPAILLSFLLKEGKSYLQHLPSPHRTPATLIEVQ